MKHGKSLVKAGIAVSPLIGTHIEEALTDAKTVAVDKNKTVVVLFGTVLRVVPIVVYNDSDVEELVAKWNAEHPDNESSTAAHPPA